MGDVGAYGLGKKNNRGDTLCNFADATQLNCVEHLDPIYMEIT